MYCSACGHLLGDGDRFCEECGAPVVQKPAAGNMPRAEMQPFAPRAGAQSASAASADSSAPPLFANSLATSRPKTEAYAKPPGSGSAVLVGAFIGLLIGYPLSYYFQSNVVKAKLSLGGYIGHMGEVLTNGDLGATAWGVWICAVILGALIGKFLSSVARR